MKDWVFYNIVKQEITIMSNKKVNDKVLRRIKEEGIAHNPKVDSSSLSPATKV